MTAVCIESWETAPVVNALLTSAMYEITATTPTECNTDPIKPTIASRERRRTTPDIRIRAAAARINRHAMSVPARGGAPPANATGSKPAIWNPAMASTRFAEPMAPQTTAHRGSCLEVPAREQKDGAAQHSVAIAVVSRIGAEPGRSVTSEGSWNTYPASTVTPISRLTIPVMSATAFRRRASVVVVGMAIAPIGKHPLRNEIRGRDRAARPRTVDLPAGRPFDYEPLTVRLGSGQLAEAIGVRCRGSEWRGGPFRDYCYARAAAGALSHSSADGSLFPAQVA